MSPVALTIWGVPVAQLAVFVLGASLLLAGSLAWLVPGLGVGANASARVDWRDERRTRWGLGLATVFLSIGLYAALGNRQALEWTVEDQAALNGPVASASDADVAKMVDKLATELAAQPVTPQTAPGWLLLGRALASLQRFEEASQALAKAVSHLPPNAALLADQADTLLAARQGNPGFMPALDPQRLVDAALKAEPDNLKALALGGTLALDGRRYGQAVSLWERAVAVAQQGAAGPELTESLQSSLDEARSRLGASGAGGAAVVGERVSSSAATPSTTGLSVRGELRLRAELAAEARPNDTVFVVARSAQAGASPMPLAVLRFRVADLPLRFELTDRASLDPARPLSSAPEVMVSARVSRSGLAAPQSGDLASAVQRVKPGLGFVALEIVSAVP